MHPYFSKTFNIDGVGTLNYWRCDRCGFCEARELMEMDSDEWATINNSFHSRIYDSPSDPFNRAGRLRGQAKLLAAVTELGIASPDRPIIDWGSGSGDLSTRAHELGVNVFSYDKFMDVVVNPWKEPSLPERHFSIVCATAVFEHLRSREELDEIERLVADDDGILAFHISCPDTIPRSVDWPFLLPVHCAFHTSYSMRVLMKQWDYRYSIYDTEAKMWMFFRSKAQIVPHLEALVTHRESNSIGFCSGFVGQLGKKFPLPDPVVDNPQLRKILKRVPESVRGPVRRTIHTVRGARDRHRVSVP